MTGGALPILTYHALDPGGSVIATDPGWFAETLTALAGAGFRTVDLADWIAGGRPPVERSVALTFDDGLRSIRLAADVLARHGFTATAFLVTGRMGGDNAWPGQPRGVPRMGLLDWSEARELSSAGFRFGAHTRTHPRLDRLDEAGIEEELCRSRDDIEQRLGEACPLLAHPYGIADGRVRGVASRLFEGAVGTRLDVASEADGRFDLPRIDAYYLRSLRTLDALIAGRIGGRLRLRRAARAARRIAAGR